jgi:cytochrome c553
MTVRIFYHIAGRLAVVALLLTACGTTPGDPANGKRLFTGEALIANGNLPACATCHADTADGQSPLGPNLSNIGNRAAYTVEGQSGEAYVRTSILDPDAHLADGFQEGIMNREYAEGLTAQQVNDLVAYLLTLKSGQD